jgi:hypothetical protein
MIINHEGTNQEICSIMVLILRPSGQIFSCSLASDSHVLETVKEVEKKGNVKINFTLEQAMRAYMGRRGIPLLFL